MGQRSMGGGPVDVEWRDELRDIAPKILDCKRHRQSRTYSNEPESSSRNSETAQYDSWFVLQLEMLNRMSDVLLRPLEHSVPATLSLWNLGFHVGHFLLLRRKGNITTGVTTAYLHPDSTDPAVITLPSTALAFNYNNVVPKMVVPVEVSIVALLS
jgi:hypothetical protein